MEKNRLSFKMVAISFVLLFPIGCATHQFPRESGKVSRFKDIAIVVDSSVTHGQTMKDPLLSIQENEAIAARLGTLTAKELHSKGYFPLDPVRIVGMAVEGRIEAIFNNPEETAAAKPASLPFLVAPASNEITYESIRNLFGNIKGTDNKDYHSFTKTFAKKNEPQGEWLPKEANPFGAKPVILINAQGHFISGGAVAANIGKGAVNTLLIIGAAAGGGGSSKLLEMDKDNLAVTFRVFDSVTGALIWKDQVKKSSNPDEAAFAAEIVKMLDRLPNATK